MEIIPSATLQTHCLALSLFSRFFIRLLLGRNWRVSFQISHLSLFVPQRPLTWLFRLSLSVNQPRRPSFTDMVWINRVLGANLYQLNEGMFVILPSERCRRQRNTIKEKRVNLLNLKTKLQLIKTEEGWRKICSENKTNLNSWGFVGF